MSPHDLRSNCQDSGALPLEMRYRKPSLDSVSKSGRDVGARQARPQRGSYLLISRMAKNATPAHRPAHRGGQTTVSAGYDRRPGAGRGRRRPSPSGRPAPGSSHWPVQIIAAATAPISKRSARYVASAAFYFPSMRSKRSAFFRFRCGTSIFSAPARRNGCSDPRVPGFFT